MSEARLVPDQGKTETVRDTAEYREFIGPQLCKIETGGCYADCPWKCPQRP